MRIGFGLSARPPAFRGVVLFTGNGVQGHHPVQWPAERDYGRLRRRNVGPKGSVSSDSKLRASAIAPVVSPPRLARHFVASFSFFFFCFSLMLSFGLLFFFGVC
jgi:hypothetical protein